MPDMLWTDVPSPIGDLVLTGDGACIDGLRLDDTGGRPLAPNGRRRDDEAFGEARMQLAEYFDGDRTEFHLPLAPRGTAFQLAVWDALRAIPYGTTTSYSAVAATIGRPGACRAVGLANGRNPIAVIVPCHRVIGTDGRLVGYGGGLDRKRYLLELEASSVAPVGASKGRRVPEHGRRSALKVDRGRLPGTSTRCPYQGGRSGGARG